MPLERVQSLGAPLQEANAIRLELQHPQESRDQELVRDGDTNMHRDDKGDDVIAAVDNSVGEYVRDFGQYFAVLEQNNRVVRDEHNWLSGEVQYFQAKCREAVVRLGEPLSETSRQLSFSADKADDAGDLDRPTSGAEIAIDETEALDIRSIKKACNFAIKLYQQNADLTTKNERLEEQLTFWDARYDTMKLDRPLGGDDKTV